MHEVKNLWGKLFLKKKFPPNPLQKDFNFGIFMANISPKLKFFASFFQKRSGAWGETPRFLFRYSPGLNSFMLLPYVSYFL